MSQNMGVPMYGETRNTKGKIAVVDPNQPNTLIWVDAKQNEFGDLMPVDPRYNVRQGYSGDNNSGGSGLLVLAAVVAVVVLVARNR